MTRSGISSSLRRLHTFVRLSILSVLNSFSLSEENEGHLLTYIFDSLVY